MQACHGIFSHDNTTYVVCHHNDGKIAFFDVTDDVGITKYVNVIRLPELIPGKFVEPKDTKMGVGVPSAHGLSYSPNGKYLLVAEPCQTGAITYRCDTHGRLLVEDTSKEGEENEEEETSITSITQHYSHVISTTQLTTPGWLMKMISYLALDGCPRIRRVAVHPNGKYVYLMSEFFNTIQVYPIDETGKITTTTTEGGGGCLQELQFAGMQLEKECWIGLGVTCASEFQVYDDCIMVSVRGIAAGYGLGKAESCIRIINYVDDDGSRLELGELIETPGPVRHFDRQGDTLWVGMNTSSYPYVQKYVKKKKSRSNDERETKNSSSYELVGEVNVGVDVMCVVAVEESSL